MRIVARTLDFCSDRSRAAGETIRFGDQADVPTPDGHPPFGGRTVARKLIFGLYRDARWRRHEVPWSIHVVAHEARPHSREFSLPSQNRLSPSL
jgi:hypothetical protein